MDIESMTSAACLVNRPEKCRGLVISLAYTGPCAGPAHHNPEPVMEEAGSMFALDPFAGGWDA
jgi:hypothetical protein